MNLETVLLYLFGSACVSTILACLIRRDLSVTKHVDIMNPGIIYTVLYLLYNFIAFVDDVALTVPGASVYASLATLGLLGIVIGTLAADRLRPKTIIRGVPIPPSELRTVSQLAVIACFMLIFVMYARHGGVSAVVAETTASRQLARTGIFSGAFYVLPVAMGLLLYSLIRQRRRSSILVCLIALCSLFILFHVASRRGELLMTMVFLTFLVHYNIRKIPTVAVPLGAVGLVVLMVVLGIVRAGHGRSAGSPVELVSVDALRANLNLRELEPYKAIVRGMEVLSDGSLEERGLSLGSTYLFAFEQVIPRAVLPWERHQQIGQWYLDMYAPELARRGGGLNFPPLLEAYANFGWSGCFLAPMIGAFIIQLLHSCATRAPRHTLIVLADCMMATTLCQIHRHPFPAYLKNSLYVFMLSGVLLLLTSVRLRASKVGRGRCG